jgi:hypothetical protein
VKPFPSRQARYLFNDAAWKGSSPMRARRLAVLLALGLAAPAADASRAPDARYAISVGGVPIGAATLRAQMQGARYEVEASADIGFLFWGGEGSARTYGAVREASLAPDMFTLAYQGVTKPGGAEIVFENGRATRFSRFPPTPPEYAENRVEVKPADLIGVSDPLSAFVIPAGRGVAPDALCRRVLAVFSGSTRFDIALEGARATLQGGAVACAARYRPISGHRADSEGVKRLTEPGAIEVSLSPLAPGLWGPQSIVVATRFGPLRVIRE